MSRNKMNRLTKFTCNDCGKVSTGIPKSVIRKNPNSAGVMRVLVCKHCQFGNKGIEYKKSLQKSY